MCINNPVIQAKQLYESNTQSTRNTEHRTDLFCSEFYWIHRQHSFTKNKKTKVVQACMWDKPVRMPAQTQSETTPVHNIAHTKVFLFNTDRQQQRQENETINALELSSILARLWPVYHFLTSQVNNRTHSSANAKNFKALNPVGNYYN